MRKPLGCKDISLRVDEDQIFLFTVYPVHSLYYVLGKFFFCKKKCSSSGQNDNAETVPVLKETLDEHND